MRLTEQSRYALLTLGVLAEHYPNAITVAEIARATGITEFNLFKLMKIIAKCGFVASARGRGGGVRLAMAPGDISVGQVLRRVEPRFQACGPADRLAAATPPTRLERRTDEVLGRGMRAFLEALDEVSIAEALGAPREIAQSALARNT
ncbi:RrF2 family transcriptional regulator [Rhabdaerophilum calidifontis]|uniref:RrF2 family transcriptional regulator n=1 Tax=Rhabdaerophilum calidifontis TaxID=2604328 RepID=UPI0014092492|nr:Rrf2 family transcriptional regulator [Rhabdaerophilum calidifontis]